MTSEGTTTTVTTFNPDGSSSTVTTYPDGSQSTDNGSGSGNSGGTGGTGTGGSGSGGTGTGGSTGGGSGGTGGTGSGGTGGTGSGGTGSGGNGGTGGDGSGGATNAPPTVTLTAPADGSSFLQPTDIAITATASSTSASIVTVDFYAGSQYLGTSMSSPYGFTITSAAAGTYVLTTVATDANGLSATSSPVTVTVNSPPPPYLGATTGIPFYTFSDSEQWGYARANTNDGTSFFDSSFTQYTYNPSSDADYDYTYIDNSPLTNHLQFPANQAGN